MRYCFKLALICFCFALPVSAQEQAVVPITKLQFYGLYQTIKFGSGFCLDPECRYIVTNYHVAKAMGKHFSIQHEPVVDRWLASGPNDEGATKEGFNPLRDLAVVELRHNLTRKGFHGLTYNTENAEDLTFGQDVDIYSYPLEFNPKRKLQHFHGKYMGINKPDGLLVFSYEPNPQHLKGGASGGLIVDSKGRVLAVLADLAVNMKNTVLGVPVDVLAAFVSKIQPYMAAQLFPKSVFISPVSADYYPEWIPPAPEPGLAHRPVEPPDVTLLRAKAQGVVDNMYSLIAVQSFEWGKNSATNDPDALGQYEVRVLDGYQHFREYPDGKKEMDEVPWPALNHVIAPGDSWISNPKMVSKDLNLKIHRGDDIVVKGQALRVFQYLGAAEDEVCNFDDQLDAGFMTIHRIHAYSCFGEVWTDQDENIIRISENFHMLGSWVNYREIVTFGWIEIEGVRSLVPITISSQAEHGSHVYWCRGMFSNYQQFRTKARMIPGVPQK